MDLGRYLRDRLHGRRVLILCLGNPLRCDDALGPYVARRLRLRGVKCVIDADGSPESFLYEIIVRRPEVLLIVDAVDAGLKPGDVIIVEGDLPSPEGTVTVTHGLPLRMLLDKLGRVLGALDVLLVGIQVRSTDYGVGLSREVRRAADALVKLLVDAIA